jgi:hypothetical protein
MILELRALVSWPLFRCDLNSEVLSSYLFGSLVGDVMVSRSTDLDAVRLRPGKAQRGHDRQHRRPW